jgi:hypothetical protein
MMITFFVGGLSGIIGAFFGYAAWRLVKHIRKVHWTLRSQDARSARDELVRAAQECEALFADSPVTLLARDYEFVNRVRCARHRIINHLSQSSIPESFAEIQTEAESITKISRALDASVSVLKGTTELERKS